MSWASHDERSLPMSDHDAEAILRGERDVDTYTERQARYRTAAAVEEQP